MRGDERDIPAYIVSMNLERRMLDESQRAMVAAKLATLLHGQRADYATERPNGPSVASVAPVTVPQAAAMLNVGERTVKRARVVAEKGAPELVAAQPAGAGG